MSWPAYLPWKSLASMVLHLVPLVTLEGSEDRKMIIGAAIFNDNRCDGNPETSREFKNFMGICTAWDSSSTESKDLYSTDRLTR